MVTAATIMTAVATAMASQLPTWKRSPRGDPTSWPVDGQGVQHHQWSIQIRDSSVVAGSWRPTTSGVPGEKTAQHATTFVIRWAHNLRADSPHTDTLAALAEIDDLFAAVSAASVAGIGQLTPSVTVYRTLGDRWYVTEATFLCRHLVTVRA